MYRNRFIGVTLAAMAVTVVVLMIVGQLRPEIGNWMIALAALGSGLVFLFSGRLKIRLKEPISDERVARNNKNALWITGRIAFPFLLTLGIVGMFVFPDPSALRYISMGIWIAVFISILIFSGAYLYILRSEG